MSPKRDSSTPSQAEQDAIDVLLWLGHNAGRELSYEDIAGGIGIPDGSRLRRAVPRARAAAHVLGHRLEQFMPSRDPLRRGARVTRFHKSGHGDEFGARDALLACRKAVAYMGDMHRACTFEANNPNSIEPEAFGQMADAAEGCIKTVSGVEGLGSKVVSAQGTIRRQAQRIADLEAQIADLTSHESAASA
ncbi:MULTISPECIES: hypothetical protein [unclassified Streptomyces]|uniref:hypothetical protein n=1 Tax=unclassified Streptomyces TaxID=2593676 RepID=UPI0007482A68|nr:MULTISPECIES: hypothetical protein [unclassified Streptomyces]KUL69410.1 hypothetical protein ADL33_31005 [Streptomyces sp. NRRL WC-3604]KUL70028.1 hypothetical protein ADL34_28655 [Streptomyces sp. NRRL WC-3605]